MWSMPTAHFARDARAVPRPPCEGKPASGSRGKDAHHLARRAISSLGGSHVRMVTPEKGSSAWKAHTSSGGHSCRPASPVCGTACSGLA